MSKYYFYGIKGAGMSALAQLLFDQNHQVKGCDYEEDFYTTEGLKERGIKIETFDEMDIPRDYVVIVGNAFTDHEKVKELRKEMYWVYTYSEFIGDLTKEFQSIAITGTHGKTTTTNLCRQVLNRMEAINFVVGDGVGGGNSLSELLVFEACEYKRHFLHYFPRVAVITNCDFDHPDYYQDLEDVKRAFASFIEQSSFVIYNGEDPNLNELMKERRKKLSVGFNPEFDFYATQIETDGLGTHFDVYCKGKFFDRFFIPMFGKHNVSNSLLSIALGLYMGVIKREIKIALSIYHPSHRRFEIFEAPHQTIVSDYAHHPTEIKATHESLRLKFKDKPIYVIFEPHTFSRTKKFVEEFKEALELYDRVYLKDIFTSVREKEETIKITDLASRIQNGRVLTDFDELKDKKDVVLVFMGAGNIDKTAKKYYEFVME